MAITPTNLFASLNAARGPLLGLASTQLITGIAQGVAMWAPTVSLVGSAQGLAGIGSIQPGLSRLVVPPNIAAVQAGLASNAIVGPNAVLVAGMVAAGVSSCFTAFGQYAGISSGVGGGQDTSKIVVAEPSSLASLILSFSGMVGPMAFPMCMGVAVGISSLLLQGVGTATVVGTVNPSGAPAVSVTNSQVI